MLGCNLQNHPQPFCRCSWISIEDLGRSARPSHPRGTVAAATTRRSEATNKASTDPSRETSVSAQRRVHRFDALPRRLT
jgi:hypothetical protein